MPHESPAYNAQQLATLGQYSIQRGDFSTAIQAFRKVIELEPTSAAAHHNLGVAYYKEGDFERAKTALHRASTLNPSSSAAPRVRGLIARDERDYPAAIQAFDEAIARSAVDSRAYSSRGIVHFYLGNHEAAIADLRQAIALNPEDVDAAYNLAVVYASSGRWDEAQECLVRCVMKDHQRATKYIAVLTDIGRAQVYEVLYQRGHRIKNALGALGARLRHFVRKLDERDSAATCHQRLDHIVAEHDQLFSQMATYLMTMKSDERTIEEVGLNGLLVELVGSCRRRAAHGARIEFITQLDERVPPILADQEALVEAVRNVLLNAVEAIATAGTITVTTALGATDDTTPARIMMTIADTGTGLAPEHIDDVFQVGFTTKKTGSGIGLSVAKRTVELHGGTIAFASIPNKGSTVTIMLPCSVDTTRLRRPIPIRSSLLEDPSELIALE